MKRKHSNSVFWEYVFVCAAVALISCLITGFLLGSIYLRSINARNEQMLQDQSVHAVQELDSQLDSMHQLSIQLSVQRIYRADHILAHKYNVLTAAQSITQYQSYCPMSSQFVLVYQNGSAGSNSIVPLESIFASSVFVATL